MSDRVVSESPRRRKCFTDSCGSQRFRLNHLDNHPDGIKGKAEGTVAQNGVGTGTHVEATANLDAVRATRAQPDIAVPHIGRHSTDAQGAVRIQVPLEFWLKASVLAK